MGQFVASSDSALKQRLPSLLTNPELVKPSPILARRATVLEEWSNLERTRALSHSEGSPRGSDHPPPSSVEGDSLASTAPPPGMLPPTLPPVVSHPVVMDIMGLTSGGSDQNGNGTEPSSGMTGKDPGMVAKFLSARYY